MTSFRPSQPALRTYLILVPLNGRNCWRFHFVLDEDDDPSPDQIAPNAIPSDLPPLEARVRAQVETHRPSQPLDVIPPPTSSLVGRCSIHEDTAGVLHGNNVLLDLSVHEPILMDWFVAIPTLQFVGVAASLKRIGLRFIGVPVGIP